MSETEQVTFLRELGEGGYGSVRLLYHSTWGEVACKKVESAAMSSDTKTEITKEANIQQNLRHPNIVTLFEAQFEPSTCLLYLEYMKYGSVDEFLNIYATSWQWKAQVVYEVALGMAYLHNQKPAIIHGDLTCANILIGYEYHAKVSDFGLAHMKEISKSKTDNPLRGTLRYIAPEYFSDPKKKKTESYDVYGFAICVWEIFSEKIAYYDFTNKPALPVYVERGGRPGLKDIDEEVPRDVSDLMTACWNKEEKHRPTFNDMKHNHFEQIISLRETIEPPVACEVEHKISMAAKNQTVASNQIVKPLYNPADIRLMTTEVVCDGNTHNQIVNGLVWFKNRIYVACEHSTTLLVISGENPFHRIPEEDIKIPEILENRGHNILLDNFLPVYPYDLAACMKSRSIFISENGEGFKCAIWKIQFPEKNISKIFSSGLFNLSRTEEHVFKLSTNILGELLALVNRVGRWYVYIFQTSDGKQTSRIVIRKINIEPLHAILSSRRYIIISYTDLAVNASFVGKMSLEGEMVREFDLKSIKSIEMFDWSPVYLTMDENNDIFVADVSGNRILLLNSQLNDCKVLIAGSTKCPEELPVRHQLDQPWRLCYVSEKDCLIVGQSKKAGPGYLPSSTVVSVFQLRPDAVASINTSLNEMVYSRT